MSVTITVHSEGLNEAVTRLARFAGWSAAAGARHIAPILESQTRRRIEEEKTAPSGAAWPANRTGTSILLRSGRHLRDAIAHRTAGGAAIVEAHWRHAHVHQTGATIRPRHKRRMVFRIGNQRVFARQVTIPARPFIGLSPANAAELVDELNAMLADLAGGRR